MFWAEPLRAHLIRLYVILTAALLPFVVWPGIDLWVARLFYLPGEGFPLDDNPVAGFARDQIWNLCIVGFVAALAAFGWSFVRAGRIPRRIWGLILAFYVLGPGLLTHAILKSEWHRARPANIAAFGGEAGFTGPFAQAGACDHNCSFVAGEVAGAVTLALAAIWILPALPRLWQRRWLAAACVVVALASSVLRMGMGRHFLSDCVFASLFMFAIWSLLSRALPAGWEPLVSLEVRRPAGRSPPRSEMAEKETTESCYARAPERRRE